MPALHILGVIRNLSINTIEQASFHMFMDLNAFSTSDFRMAYKQYFHIKFEQCSIKNKLKLQKLDDVT